MKYNIVLFMTFSVFIISTLTQDVAAQADLRKSGIVSVTTNASGQVTAMKLIVPKYDIKLDERSKPLLSMHGKEVSLTGTIYKGQFIVKDEEQDEEQKPIKDKSMPIEELRIKGIMRVLKKTSGQVTHFSLIPSYDIKLDERSKPLQAMNGQRVTIACSIQDAGGKRMLTVKKILSAIGSKTTSSRKGNAAQITRDTKERDSKDIQSNKVESLQTTTTGNTSNIPQPAQPASSKPFWKW